MLLHFSTLGAALFAIWLLLSGFFTDPFLLSLGVASVALTIYLIERMDRTDQVAPPLLRRLRVTRLWLVYVPWLFVEMVKSAIDVAKAIVSPSLPIAPRIIKITASQKTDLSRTTYANSITFTPGTVTMDMKGDVFTVHALTAASAEGLLSGDMDRRVTATERFDDARAADGDRT